MGREEPHHGATACLKKSQVKPCCLIYVATGGVFLRFTTRRDFVHLSCFYEVSVTWKKCFELAASAVPVCPHGSCLRLWEQRGALLTLGTVCTHRGCSGPALWAFISSFSCFAFVPGNTRKTTGLSR